MSENSKRIDHLLLKLTNEGVKTWFDLGIFLDRIQDQPTQTKFEGDFTAFKDHIDSNAIGMISFFFTIDGITVEADKYTKVLKGIFPQSKIHYIAGEIHKEAYDLIDTPYKKEIREMDGFDNWPLYAKFFKEKIERGSPGYNALIKEFWNDTLTIVEKLGNYIEENNIQLLYIINVCSNPGNVSLALATVLLSEFLHIPVINNNHDFYWEGGSRAIDIKKHGVLKGPRDFFFTNADVGEFFSVIDVLYPWRSRSWMTLNINRIQYEHCILKNGHNPNNVEQIGTALDHSIHQNVSKRNMIRAFKQTAHIFANNKDNITVHTVSHHLDSERARQPILLGSETIRNFDFVNNNIVFLQPTRVISRKSIELNFKLISKLFANKSFQNKFIENPELKISMIVTGPIPHGQLNYYRNLLADFSDFLESLDSEFKSKIFLGFLFSEFDKDRFKQKYNTPIDINRLYQIASLILLPSQTEGRGLPILEAAASGTPIYCRQYDPREVYEEVIGMHLSERNRLKVLEFRGSKLSQKLIDDLIDQVFYPQNNVDIVEHNLNVIKYRYSFESLERNMLKVIKRLLRQLNSCSYRETNTIADLFKRYETATNFRNKDLEAIMNLESRQYLPGYGKLGFMIYLKSLIDPSYFRVEEQLFRGRVLDYATSIHKKFSKDWKRWGLDARQFYNLVEEIFHYHEGEMEIQHDHSLAYRHRNRLQYKYRNYTYQEIIGLTNMIHQETFKDVQKRKLMSSPQFFTGWELALHQMTNSDSLGIDNRKRLTKTLKRNVPKGYFPGDFIKHEMEYFILQPFRKILNLSIEDELTEELLIANKDQLSKSYIFVKEPASKSVFFDESIIEYLESGQEYELTMLYNHDLVQVVKTKQWCGGVHFPQMGAEALKVLREIKEKDGFIIANGQRAAMMSDIINIDRFHIGKAKDILTAKVMGIPHNSGFIQFVPAGVRTTLAYPTPVQTSKDFDKTLQSDLFKELAEKYGEKELFKLMAKDAEENGSPIQKFLNDLKQSEATDQKEKEFNFRYVGGVYADGMPWSGVMAEINTQNANWKFNAHFAKKGPKNVPALLKEANKTNALIAWNGGYILNNELVGKLGLPETYIGSPLGLLILNGRVKCPPLFNKPAFIIYKDGKIDIKRVSSCGGFKVYTDTEQVLFEADSYNQVIDSKPSFFDIHHDEDHFISKGAVVIRIAGNTVKEIYHSAKGEKVDIIAVGITLLIPENEFSEKVFKKEKEIEIQMTESETKWSEIEHAIEAGPMLVDGGEKVIDMEVEGWKTLNSIKTQAARLDYTDMRGPKIAVGIDDKGSLKVLAVNGRIRESVGATHIDMADILKEQGMTKAMGFDPGGSSTLYVDGAVKNISPYNSKYEEDIYALPPEPRFVSNIIFGWVE